MTIYSDYEYSDELVIHARQLYSFASEFPGKYDKSIKNAHKNYPSTEFTDELVWAAAWLYLATEEESFLQEAERLYMKHNISESSEFSWDDKGPGVMALLAMITQDSRYLSDLQAYCDDMVDSRPRSPGGMVFISRWGSLRHAANAAFICLAAARLGVQGGQRYTEFAEEQLNYILGLREGGHSFVVGGYQDLVPHKWLQLKTISGFGTDPPRRPHHAASSCPARPAVCDWSAFSSPGPNPHVLVGALVGGPDNKEDRWEDDRGNYVTNEVSLDYNAGLCGLLSGMIELKTI